MAEEANPLKARVKEARLQTAVRLGKTVSQAEMAQLVGAVLGRTLAQAQWSRYEQGDSEPPLVVIRAIADISGLPESYIAFGQEPAAPADRAQQIMDELRARGFERLTDKSETPAAQAITKPSAPKKAADGGKRGRRGR